MLTEQQRQLVQENLDLAQIWVRSKYKLSKKINRDEAYAEACYQLCRVVRNLKNHDNVRAFLWRGVCLGMQTWISRDAVPIEWQLLNDCPISPKHESNLDWLCADLPDRLRLVIERYYVSGNTLKDIARDLGVCEQRAQQLKNQAVKLLREKVGSSDGR